MEKMKNLSILHPLILILLIIVACSSTDDVAENKNEDTDNPKKNEIVSTISDLNEKIKSAIAGDTIILKNNTYTDAKIVLHAEGESKKPIVVKAETPGKVFIEGNSNLRISGHFVEVHGLVFRNGYGKNVWEFRSESNKLANSCRITNSVIDGYNDADDKEVERWVLLYGKNNKIDHCTFKGKENEGVLMAVILEEGSNNNHHIIENNYFGDRPVLKHVNNGGEIIRIGDSSTSHLSSGTIVRNNVFENCDGETEIISVKSCDNTLFNNFFIESAGALVLRHGNRNLVEKNVFIGNNKSGCSGIRVINSGHTIKSNFFSGLVGSGLRSAFSIMNGLENPKPYEYHIVKDVVIVNNTFVECANISFNLRHSDPERYSAQTVIPENVDFQFNIFFNNKTQLKFNFLDGAEGVKGICFKSNTINTNILNNLNGFDLDVNMSEPAAPQIFFLYGVNYSI